MKSDVYGQILVVDDEAEFADFVQRGLSYEGYIVTVAESASQAWDAIEAQLPDLRSGWVGSMEAIGREKTWVFTASMKMPLPRHS